MFLKVHAVFVAKKFFFPRTVRQSDIFGRKWGIRVFFIVSSFGPTIICCVCVCVCVEVIVPFLLCRDSMELYISSCYGLSQMSRALTRTCAGNMILVFGVSVGIALGISFLSDFLSI